MDKRFWGVIAAIAVIFIGIILVNNRNNSGGNSGAGTPTNHIDGEGKQNVTLVEYGDFECPVCYSYASTVDSVVQQYKTDIYFQFRNFPIQQIHKNAFAGARAAEAADKQGKYWEMHNMLYQNQDPNGQTGWVASNDPLNQYFSSFAKQLGLNIDQFKKDYASEAVNKAINADIAAANKLKVSGTPTFFLDGKEIPLKELVNSSGQPDATKFGAKIEAAIKAKGGTVTPPAAAAPEATPPASETPAPDAAGTSGQ